jgi:hypothetical protein
MSTLGEIRTLIFKAIARDDPEASTVVDAAINYAIIMASLTFEPAEIYKTSDVMIQADENMLYLPNLVVDIDIDETNLVGMFQLDGNGDLMPIDGNTLATNLLDIIKIYNKTGDYKLDFIPYEFWDTIVPSALAELKYWTMFGNYLYFKVKPSSNKMLSISYSTYPLPLTDAADSLPFDYHDSYIISTATAIAWAIFEEQDPAAMWARIAAFVGDPAAMGAKASAVIEGQKVLLETVMQQVKEGTE